MAQQRQRWFAADDAALRPRAVLATYGCAFLRKVLAGHDTIGFLVGTELPPATQTSLVHLAFKWKGAITVDDYEQPTTIAVNSLNESNSQVGVSANKYGMSQTAPNQFNHSFYGDSIGMVAVPRAANGTLRSQLTGPTNLVGREIWVRVADIFDGTFPAAATGFELGLELPGGSVTWVDSDDVGGLSLPFDYGPRTKSMLSTLRFPVHCFVPSKRRKPVFSAILFRFNRSKARALAFDDLQIV